MTNKPLTLGLAALIILAGVVVFGKTVFFGHKPAAQQEVTETAAPSSEPAAPSSETAAAPEAPAVTPTEAATQSASEAPVAATPAPATTETAAAPAAAEKPAAEKEDGLLAAPQGLDIDVAKAMEERVLGSPDAPVTIIEYASMTCPHCAHFSKDLFADVKAKLIDTGKAMFIFREYPLDGVAMKASKIARCADRDKFFNLIEVFYQNQERWIKADDPVKVLAQYAALAGMDENLVNVCVNSAELENALLGKINEGQTRYNINQTPTFIFNGGEEKLSGAYPVEKFEEIVNKLTAAKGK